MKTSEFETSFKPNKIAIQIRARIIERTLRKIPKEKDVLDLCCGYGFYFLINPQAQGIDGDPSCALYLKNKGIIIPLANILTTLPYKSDCFSFVIAHDVFEHFYMVDLQLILKEVHRILKPSGELIVFVPNRKGYDFGTSIKIGHKTFFTKAEVESLIPNLFQIKAHYAEPFPRFIGKWFTHNKEVFVLQKI